MINNYTLNKLFIIININGNEGTYFMFYDKHTQFAKFLIVPYV